MAVEYLDLGMATFSLPKAKLQLDTRASAVLRPQKDDKFDSSSCLNIEQWPSYRDIWICKSHDFHLSFLACFDQQTTLATGTEKPCLDNLGHILESAELWSQLDLQPCLSLSSPNNLESTHFSLGFSDQHIQEAEKSLSTSAPPKSMLDPSNLRAPRNVLTVHLKSIQICLHFSSIPSARSQVSDTVLSDAPFGFEELLEQAICLPESSTLSQFHQGDDQLQVSKHDSGIIADLYSGVYWSDKLLAEATKDSRSPALPERQLTLSSTGSANVVNDAVTVFKTKAIRKNKGPDLSGCHVPIIQLTDAGLRTLISTRPGRLAAGIKPSGSINITHVADLAPAVFVPGYREKVQSRSTLIPVIADVLSHYLHQPRTATQEKQRRSLLKQMLVSGAQTQGDEPFSEVEELKESLKGHLWMTFANSIQKLETPPRLKMLHVAGVGETAHLKIAKFEDLLLSENAEHTLNNFEAGFEGFSTDNEEDFEDLEDDHFSHLYGEALSGPTRQVEQGQIQTCDILLHEDQHHDLQGCNDLFCTCDPDEEDLFPNVVDAIHIYSAADRDGKQADDSYVGKGSTRITNTAPQTSTDSDECHFGYWDIRCTQEDAVHNMIGGYPHASRYVSRTHPNDNHFEDILDSQLIEEAKSLKILDAFDLHEFFDFKDLILERDYYQSVEESGTDIDIDMSAYERSNETSLSNALGNDHSLWPMWTMRRSSMVQSDKDMLEMHAMYASDPDMKLLDQQRTMADESLDEYMLDSAFSSPSSSRSSTSPSIAQDALPYRPRPVEHQSLRSSSPKEFITSSFTRDDSRQKSSKGLQGFLKRISFSSKTSIDETHELSRPSAISEQREMDVRRRKTLADYDDMPDGDEMLLA